MMFENWDNDDILNQIDQLEYLKPEDYEERILQCEDELHKRADDAERKLWETEMKEKMA